MSCYIKIVFNIFFFFQCVSLQCGGFTAVNGNYSNGITIDIKDDVRVIDEGMITIGTTGQDLANITLNIFTNDVEKIKHVINAKSINALCSVNVIINIYG